MNPTIPAPAPPAMSPPMVGGGGFMPPQQPQMPMMPPPPPKGGLPIKIIASIQGIYAKEEQKQMALQGLDKSLSLQPGWGGQGR